MADVDVGRRYLTMSEVTSLLRLHRQTVTRLAKSGQLAAVKVGKQYRFHPQGVRDFLDANRVGVKAAS